MISLLSLSLKWAMADDSTGYPTTSRLIDGVSLTVCQRPQVIESYYISVQVTPLGYCEDKRRIVYFPKLIVGNLLIINNYYEQ